MKINYSIEDLLVILGAYLMHHKRPYFMITYTSYDGVANELRLARLKSVSVHQDPLTELINLLNDDSVIGIHIPNGFENDKQTELNQLIKELVEEKSPKMHIL